MDTINVYSYRYNFPLLQTEGPQEVEKPNSPERKRKNREKGRE